MVGTTRMRWMAAACVAALAVGALAGGAHAWAAQGDERCRPVPLFHDLSNGNRR